jgi:hypothetical protein
MIDVRAAIRPLIGTGQGGMGFAFVKPFAGYDLMFDIPVERFELRSAVLPIIQRGL